MFFDSYERKRDLTAGYTFGHTLIIGPYGGGKTTGGVNAARADFIGGHPLFSNTACVVGWGLGYEELYTAIGFMPKASVLLIDESSASYNARLSIGVGISTATEAMLNTRKQLVRTYQMSAQDRMIARSIRSEIDNVWMPVPKDKLKVEASRFGISPRNPARDPDNFRIAWFAWVDKPYDQGMVILNEDKTKGGFGPPDYVYYDEGDGVRDSYLLTDTFDLAPVGVARTLDNDKIKGFINEGLGKASPAAVTEKLLSSFLDNLCNLANPPKWLRPMEIAESVNMTNQGASQAVRQMYPNVTYIKAQGFHVEELIAAEAMRRNGGVGELADYMAQRRSIEDVIDEALRLDPYTRPGSITAKDIAAETGLTPQDVGRYISENMGLNAKRGRGLSARRHGSGNGVSIWKTTSSRSFETAL